MGGGLMDAIINLPEFVWEFVSRQDFIGAYFFLVALPSIWFGLRGLLGQHTKGFGTASADVIGQDAVHVGSVWLAAGGSLLVLGAYLWQSA